MNATRMTLGLAVAGLLAVALTGCECMKCCSSSKTEVKDQATIKVVKIDKLAEIVKAPGTAIVVDARGWKPGMEVIPGAINIKDENTDTDIATLLPNKNVAIVTYCANTRCTASPMLAKRLVKLGYTNVSEYPEGIAGWKEAGKPVDTIK